MDPSPELWARSGGLGAPGERPPAFKAVGISLAIGSGLFIGSSFVLKKYGLLKANEKYNEVAGEGYGYLKNVWWWAGMILMIVGEICNFVAYAFTDAILVTPLGALSVVLATVLSAFFLKERLSMVGKVACFLCIVGSVVIVLNAPESSSVATIQEMQGYVVSPGFLSYAGVIVVGAIVLGGWGGPKWGRKNMLVYISICSWIGGLSVVATQGLGAAIVAQAGGTPQFNQWFLYILLVFVITTLLTEIIYLNKALNIFNAAMVTPTYYVYFTSTTIITSAVLFRGFRGTATSIVTVVLGFLTICAGVVLLQLSKSAKDVPDTAVFKGDLDQIHTIAEQEEPETEPRADAIRGAAAIVRRISVARQKRELDELRRLHEEKLQEQLEIVSEDAPTLYEWDGIRRRRTTTLGSSYSRNSGAGWVPPPRSPHPPLGMTRFPTDDEPVATAAAAEDDPHAPGIIRTLAGSIRSRSRTIGPDDRSEKVRSPLGPSPLSEVSLRRPPQTPDDASFSSPYRYHHHHHSAAGSTEEHNLGLPVGLRPLRPQPQTQTRHVVIAGDPSHGALHSAPGGSPAPTPPAGGARRHFSFQNMFRRHASGEGPPSPLGAGRQQQQQHTADGQTLHPPRSAPHHRPAGGTEEERLGLVKGDSQSMPDLPHYDVPDDDGDSDSGNYLDRDDEKLPAVVSDTISLADTQYGRRITDPQQPLPSSSSPLPSPAPDGEGAAGGGEPNRTETDDYEQRRQRWAESNRNRERGGTGASTPTRHPPTQ